MFDRFFAPMESSVQARSLRALCATASDRETHCDFAQAGLGRGYALSQADGPMMTTLVDARLERSLRTQAETRADLLIVRAALSTDCDYALPGSEPWSYRRPGITVTAVPKDMAVDIRIHTSAAQRAVTVVLEPSTLLRQHGIAAGDLPAPLREVVDGRLDRPKTLLSMPVQADISSLVHDLVHSRLTGALRRMQIQARAGELLALVTAAWIERANTEHWPGARGRDGELVAAARRILSEHFADPPTLHELSSRLGTNKNKLNQLFQRHLGMTPQGYCLQRRIERAQALLAEGRLNVGQVADAVGYQHQSSFTVAFRDVVGESPRDYVRRHQPEREPAPMH
jgi:AraC-like DNA-binding protein